jgi:pantetheine-phosphate adenylyltransferase
MSIAIVPGSFDPMTLGHLDVVKRALALYDEVVVAVMVNPNKQYLHTLQERAEMARLTLGDLERVRVVTSEGLLIDLFDSLHADVIVKGIRNERDRLYEEEMAAWNLKHNPRAVTVFLQAADDFEDISSTEVRARMENGECTDDLVAPAVAEFLGGKR